MQPLGKQVAIKPKQAGEEKSAGGIILVKGQEPTSIGEIVAVGAAVECVKEGQKVIYPSGAGTRISSGEGEILIMSEDKLLAIV